MVKELFFSILHNILNIEDFFYCSFSQNSVLLSFLGRRKKLLWESSQVSVCARSETKACGGKLSGLYDRLRHRDRF